jgi:hypothetical protein
MKYGAQLIKACLEEQPEKVADLFAAEMANKVAIVYEATVPLVGEAISSGNLEYDEVIEEAFEALNEDEVPGVAPGSLPDEKHLCATKVFHPEYGVGQPLFSEHAEPDQNGFVEWYNVEFEDVIMEQVPTSELQVLMAESHMNHSPKKKKKKM